MGKDRVHWRPRLNSTISEKVYFLKIPLAQNSGVLHCFVCLVHTEFDGRSLIGERPVLQIKH